MEQVRVIKNSLVFDLIRQIRDKESDTSVFKAALNSLSTILAVNCLEDVDCDEIEISTPLTKTKALKIDQSKIHLISVFRAGEALLHGFRNFVPNAATSHLGIKRNEKDLTANCYLKSLSQISSGDRVFILDPMLATAVSAKLAIEEILKSGSPKSIDFVCVIASKVGIQKLSESYPDIRITTCQIDSELNSRGYIVPGLGDAGDRFFSTN